MNDDSHKINKELHQCPGCQLYYKKRGWKDKCEAWCKEHHSCNVEIIRHAVENNKSYEPQ